MNPSLLLKTLLPGLAPLLVFVAADAIFGEVVGLAVGLAVGAGEFLWTLVRDRRADPFVAADTALLAIAGGLSIGLRNELFFKLKPAVIELVLGSSMALLLALPPSFLKAYMSRMLKGMTIADSALPAMKKSLGLMLCALGLHACLVVYAALALPTAAWGFVSGGLLYILFAGVGIWQFFSARRAGRAGGEEILPLVDEEGRVLGSAPRSECHRGRGKLHPVVHLQIFDGEGRMYLQKRAASREVQPGMWDSAIGGHVGMGEDAAQALSRELREELGITSMHLEAAKARPGPAFRYVWRTEIEEELVFSFAMRYAGPFAPDGSEVEEGRFWSLAELRAAVGTGVLTPNFEMEFRLYEEAAKARKSSPTVPARPD
jgi:isopentenyldiphosphate isomerase/intracellular septation protein A